MTIAGKYIVEAVLGSGVFATVFQARNVDTN